MPSLRVRCPCTNYERDVHDIYIVHTYPPFEYHLIVFLEVRTRRMAVSTHPYCIMVSCSPQEIIQHLHLEKWVLYKLLPWLSSNFFFQLWREQIELLLSSWNFILVFFISSDIWFVNICTLKVQNLYENLDYIISTHHQYSFFKTLLFQLFFLSHYGWSFFPNCCCLKFKFYGGCYTISHTVYMRWEGPYIQHT